MSKISRRKQSKPQHISNGSDDEAPGSSADVKEKPEEASEAVVKEETERNLANSVKEEPNDTCDPKKTEPVKFVRITRKQAQLLKASEEKDHLNGPCVKVKDTKETNNNDKIVSDTEVDESEQEETGVDATDLDSSDVTSKIADSQPMTTNHPRLRDRTCEYCAAVKPTPAALARHLRKHTGERPFVCQGCNKAYKAKRSLQLHQLTYHPELVNKTSPHQAGVSLCTSSLLREALETRIRQDLSKYSGPHLDETTGEFIDEALGENPEVNPKTDPPAEEEKTEQPISMIGALLSKTVDMPTVHKIAYAADTARNEEEESAEKLSNRTCNICGKVCSKPCDLKRHILMHTGERPYKCEVCGKCFKAKASMLYHQRAAHNMAVELSQGLEERYLRLKNRPLAKNIYMQDHFSEYERSFMAHGSAHHGGDELEDIDETDKDFTDKNNLYNADKSGVRYNEEFSRQISHTSDGSALEEDSAFNESLENGTETLVMDDGEYTCNKLRIRNETVIVTRLDGVNTGNGKEVTMFKCYICGRMFSSLQRIQCHLSMHFELEITTYQCKYCDSTFKQKSQMVQHVLKHKIKGEYDDGVDMLSDDEGLHIQDDLGDSGNDVSGISPSSESDNTKVKSDGSETSPDCNSLKPARFNGIHECKYCRKTFSRQFLLQRHERIHTGQKAFYCKECGKGFSESVNLSQHMSLFHSDSPQVRHAATLYNRAKHRSLLRVNDWDKYSRQSQDHLKKAIESLEKSSSKTVHEKHEDMEKAKELLEKDGIKEEVTVVMPSAPPSNQTDTTPNAPDPTPAPTTTASSEIGGDPDDSSNSEIMTAPKRSLISFCKEGPALKSRRKTSLPTKLDSAPSPGSSAAEGALEDEIKIKEEKMDCYETDYSIVANSEESITYSTATMLASMSPMILANNAASSVRSNSGIHPRMSTPSSSSAGSLMNMPISVQCPTSEAPSTKSPASPTQSTSSTSQPSPADPEMLVGCPRVQWNASMSDDPSSPPMYSRDSDRKPLPDWHPLSKVALNQIVSHDGRKVTSLSRTHSRLHVVNQPVDREQVCKPTILPDGRTVYRCYFCSKDFLSFSDINRHMDFHEDIRPYKCQYCDYYARTNSQLKVHMMRHQGIREFCCKLCNYKGVTQSDLNRHMKSQIHMLKARNECKRCGEGFVTPKNLEKHQESSCARLNSRDDSVDQNDYDS